MVEVGSLHLYFSYETIVAFRAPQTGFIVSENVWSKTTGKHLNWIDPYKSNRVKHTDFELILSKVLKEAGL